MPFSEKFFPVYDAIQTVIQSEELSMRCIRADEKTGGGYIMDSILSSISESQFIIADLTDKNANVFYELGIAHMVKDHDKVILLTQNMEEIPFDVRHFRHIVYSQATPAKLHNLKIELMAAIKTSIPNQVRFGIRKGQRHYLVDRKFFGEQDRFQYEVEIPQAYPETDSVKFVLKMYRFSADGSRRVMFEDANGLMLDESMDLRYIPWELKYEGILGDRSIFVLVKENILR